MKALTSHFNMNRHKPMALVTPFALSMSEWRAMRGCGLRVITQSAFAASLEAFHSNHTPSANLRSSERAVTALSPVSGGPVLVISPDELWRVDCVAPALCKINAWVCEPPPIHLLLLFLPN
jgi:hypothetical protein